MSGRIYDRPVGYLPAYELSRLHSGHGAQLRSAKFGPSALDGDVPVYLESSALALVQAERVQVLAEPVAWMTYDIHGAQMVWTDYEEACVYCDDDEQPIPLYMPSNA